MGHSEKVLRLEAELRRSRIFYTFLWTMVVAIPGSIIGLYIATALTWHRVNLRVYWWPAITIDIILIAVVIACFVSDLDIRPIPEIRLDLELARERRRMESAKLNLGAETRQQIYRDVIPRDIERFNREGTYYRRIHNFLQAIIIIGSLAASTLTGLVQYVHSLHWIAVGATFSVGLAAGFSGYFKFRERSFYLQLTADSIEHEFSAVELGIGRYKNKSESQAMTEFTERVEQLKEEQRKRQQQLEQPSGGKESVQ